MAKGKGTPDDLDYLFERDIIHEEDYVEFWSGYWKRHGHQRDLWVNDWLEVAETAIEKQGGQVEILAGVVTRNKSQAKRQAAILGGRIVRRNAKGWFSKRGTYYQAVRKSGKKHDRKKFR